MTDMHRSCQLVWNGARAIYFPSIRFVSWKRLEDRATMTSETADGVGNRKFTANDCGFCMKVRLCRGFLTSTASLFLLVQLCILLSFANAAGNISKPANMSSRVWRVQNGLPQNAIQALAQTPDGYLWIGTNGGLVRFDGTEFRSFKHTNTSEFTEDSILQLFVSRDGALWIGTEGGGLVQYNAGHFHRFGKEHGLTNEFVRAIYQDTAGKLWVGTDRGLFLMKSGRLERIDAQNGFPSINVYSVTGDDHGHILVGCTDADNTMGILELIEKTQVRWYEAAKRSGDRRVWLLHRANDGSLWIGAGRELWHWPSGYMGDLFSNAGLTQQAFRISASRGSLTNEPITVTTLEEDADHRLWFGTSNAGVFRVDHNKIKHFEAPNFIPDNTILSMAHDAQGNLWIGTANGLTRLASSAATVVTGVNQSPISIKTVYQSTDGTLWATTSGDRLLRLQDEAWVPACLPKIPCWLAVRTFVEDSRRNRWVGTTGQGLYVVSEGGVQHYPEMDLVRAFAEAPDGSMWVGMDSGLTHMGRTIHEHLNGDGGLGSDSVRALLFDRDGNLWVGTDAGVALIRDGHIVPLSILDAMRGKKIYAIVQDDDGGLWFGARGAGLWYLKGDMVRHIGLEQGLLSDNILGLLLDRNGKLWISSAEGIFSVRRDELLRDHLTSSPIPIHVFGASEGVSASQMNAAIQPSVWRASNGDLWFASSSGAVHLQPTAVSEPKPFPVLIDGITSKSKEVAVQREKVDLSPLQQNFEIHYAAINLQNPEHVRFRYQLEGFDHAWVDAGDRRTAFYTNVPPGEYRFHVLAYDSDIPSRPSRADLIVHRSPAWYQTRWFLLACALTIGMLILSVYRLRLRTIRARFSAVLEERNRLAREMHDTLIQGCVGVSTLLEAAASTYESEPTISQQVLTRARYQIHETVEEARRSVWNLRHRDAIHDLSGALQELARHTSESISVEFHSDCAPKAVLVDEMRYHELLHIAREATSNALAHAEASVVTIHLSWTAGQLSLSVADDGKGFVRSEESGLHYGLIGMEERARKLDGTFTMTSMPGEGTCVSVLVPVFPQIRTLREEIDAR